MYIVVQDSFYKDVHNDLPHIISEMGENLGWSLVQCFEYPIPQTVAGINNGSRKYRHQFGATESTLVFNAGIHKEGIA